MEADWEFEVAADAPGIHAAWEGYVDLSREPDRAAQLPEAGRFFALAPALVRLNHAASLVRTFKCDVWEVESFDPDELDAPHESAATALACYIDLLAAGSSAWSTLDRAADWCRRLCAALRAEPLRSARVDLVIRRAFIAPERVDLGITAYLIACGATQTDAEASLGAALRVFADAVCPSAPAG